ncbi:MAG: SDR family oxidoreductase [Rhodothermia bacterium]|nr:SDR family oxidoreductase [Rhodothermia bacterium]
MKTLVTGGAGFIGSNLVRRLLADGHEVSVFDDLSTGNLSNIEGLDARFIEGSILEQRDLDAAMTGVEVVFHQAALPSVPRSLANPALSNQINLGGTLQVLLAARDAGVRRLIYAASSSAYGDTTELPKTESMAPNPASPYAVAKLGGEYYCRAFSRSFQLPTIALRYFNVFGPYQDPEGGYAAVVPSFITSVLRGESPTIYGDGDQTRDFTYIDNVVEANLLAMLAPDSVAGEVLNIACGERISVNELLALVVSSVGRDGGEVRPIHAPARVGDVRDSLADVSRARRLLGYNPLVDHAAGIRRTVQWYQDEGRLVGDPPEDATQEGV